MLIFSPKNIPYIKGLRVLESKKEGLLKNIRGEWVDEQKAKADREKLYALYLEIQKKKGVKVSTVPASYDKMSLPVLSRTLRAMLHSLEKRKESQEKFFIQSKEKKEVESDSNKEVVKDPEEKGGESGGGVKKEVVNLGFLTPDKEGVVLMPLSNKKLFSKNQKPFFEEEVRQDEDSYLEHSKKLASKIVSSLKEDFDVKSFALDLKDLIGSQTPDSPEEVDLETTSFLKKQTSSVENAGLALIQAWYRSSNGSALSQMMQQSAKNVFGADTDSFKHDTEEFKSGKSVKYLKSKKVLDFMAKHQKAVDKIAKAMYEETQKQLKEKGIKEVTVLRGAEDYGKQLSSCINGGKSIDLNPLSSWTCDKFIAKEFCDDVDFGRGIIMKTTVPASRIFSTGMSGVGTLGESEVVLIGGKNVGKVGKYNFEL